MTTLEGIASIEEIELANQRVFVRVDFNVPLDSSRKVTSDARIRASLPTLEYAVDKGARVIVAAHLGRPQGKHVPKLSLEPAGARLSELTGWDVLFPDDCIGDAAKKVVTDMRDGQVVLLENLRFHAEEEANAESFARDLAKLSDVYINDAFGSSHRAHASMHALPKLMRTRGVGFLVQSEVQALDKLTRAPAEPFIAIVGGATLGDKIELIEALLHHCQALCIGGAMANTLLAARGHDMKASRIEHDGLARARSLLEDARQRRVDVLLPTDVVTAESPEAASGRSVRIDAVPQDHMALDIGPETVSAFADRLRQAKTVFWNGPMGSCDNPAFRAGTLGVAQALSRCEGFTVAAGSDAVAALETNPEDLAQKIDHISTGGGASLELLEGKPLPGIEALRN